MLILKGCPFCGAKPTIKSRPNAKFYDYPWVAFVACYCGGYASTAHQMGQGSTQQEAIDAVVILWNNRPATTAQYSFDTPLP